MVSIFTEGWLKNISKLDGAIAYTEENTPNYVFDSTDMVLISNPD